MKHKLGVKRDLLEEWLNILTEMSEAGEYLATLEYADDSPSVRKFKQKAIKLREKIRIFTIEKIDPIRIKLNSSDVYGMRQGETANNGETES